MLTCMRAPADQFPCQFQLFYRGKARKSMWYDPVFRVRPKFPGTCMLLEIGLLSRLPRIDKVIAFCPSSGAEFCL